MRLVWLRMEKEKKKSGSINHPAMHWPLLAFAGSCHVDVRGEHWDKNKCTACVFLIGDLKQVPAATSSVILYTKLQ